MQTQVIFYILVIFTCNGQTHLVRLSKTKNRTDNEQPVSKWNMHITNEQSTILNARMKGETAFETSNIQPTKSNEGTASENSKMGLMSLGKETTTKQPKMIFTKSKKGTVNEKINSISPKLNREVPNFHDSFFLRDLSRGDREAIEDFVRYHTFVDTPFDILRQFLGIQDHLKINQIPDFSDVLRRLVVHGHNLNLAGMKPEVGDGRSQGLSEITHNKRKRENFITNLQREHSALRTGSKFMKFLTQLRNSLQHTRQPEFLDSQKLQQEMHTSLNEHTAFDAISNESKGLPNNKQRSKSESITLNIHNQSIVGNDAVIKNIDRLSELRTNSSMNFEEQNNNNRDQLKSSVKVQPDDDRVIQFIDNILARENAVKSDIHNTRSPAGSKRFKPQQTLEGSTDIQAGTGENGENHRQTELSSNSQMSTHTDKRDNFFTQHVPTKMATNPLTKVSTNGTNGIRAKDFSESITVSPELSSREEIPTTNRHLAPQKRFPEKLKTKTTESQSSSLLSVSLPLSVKSRFLDMSPTINNANPVTSRSPTSGIVTKVLHWPPIEQQQKFDVSRFAVSVSSEVVTSTPRQVLKSEKDSLPPPHNVSRTISKTTPRIVTKILQWPILDTQRKSDQPIINFSPTTIFSTTPTSLQNTQTTSDMFTTTRSRWRSSIVESIVKEQLVRGRGKDLAETTKNSEVPHGNMLSVTVKRDGKINENYPEGDRKSSARPHPTILAKKGVKKDRNRSAGRFNSFIIPNVRRISAVHTTRPSEVTSSFVMLNSVQSPRTSFASLWDGFDLAWFDFFTKVWCDDCVFIG